MLYFLVYYATFFFVSLGYYKKFSRTVAFLVYSSTLIYAFLSNDKKQLTGYSVSLCVFKASKIQSR